MSHKIFLSHNYNDKPIVEPVAIKLASIFGQDYIFYDSWSIRPGDGIIDRMNKGLTAPEYVFFFVSANSLKSDMVKLEWQNALYAATKGKTRLIPVRVDGCDMPALLAQSLYIDMHINGLESSVAQIVSVAQGNTTFTPQHQEFSNLTGSIFQAADGKIEITIKASHLVEPNPNFAFVIMNAKEELGWWIKDAPGIIGGFQERMFTLNDGNTVNAITMKPFSGSLTPNNSLTFLLNPKSGVQLEFFGVMHEKGNNQWKQVPLIS